MLVGQQLAYLREARLGSRPLSNNIVTTLSQRGKPWITLLGEGRFGIASRPFGKDQGARDFFACQATLLELKCLARTVLVSVNLQCQRRMVKVQVCNK